MGKLWYGDNENKLVTVDRLMSSHFIDFDDHKLHGIYIQVMRY